MSFEKENQYFTNWNCTISTLIEHQAACNHACKLNCEQIIQNSMKINLIMLSMFFYWWNVCVTPLGQYHGLWNLIHMSKGFFLLLLLFKSLHSFFLSETILSKGSVYCHLRRETEATTLLNQEILPIHCNVFTYYLPSRHQNISEMSYAVR